MWHRDRYLPVATLRSLVEHLPADSATARADNPWTDNAVAVAQLQATWLTGAAVFAANGGKRGRWPKLADLLPDRPSREQETEPPRTVDGWLAAMGGPGDPTAKGR